MRIWKVLSLVPTGESKIIGCFWKIFCFTKDPFTHLDKGGRNAHPFPGFFSKIFLRKNFTLHLFGITKPNDTLFHRKNEKIFFVRLLDGLFLLVQKSPFTYSHWEEANSNPVSKNILLFAKPLHLFGIRRLKRTLFSQKNWKIFFSIEELDSAWSKSPFTYSHWEQPNAPPKS